MPARRRLANAGKSSGRASDASRCDFDNEFENEAEAIAFYEKLKTDEKCVQGAEIKLPDGRKFGFDHYLAKLRAEQDRGSGI